MSDIPVSHEAREAAGMFLLTDPHDPVAQPLAIAFDKAIAAAEQRGRLAERERCAGIAKTAWFVCALDVIMDADAAQHLCERTEQAILSAKDRTHG